MTSVSEHYQAHLAPVYAWMCGGLDAATARGESEIESVLPDLASGSRVVDLGAGFGMHSIPLGRRGCSVLAIDTSPELLEQIRIHAASLPVRAVEDDLLEFPRYLDGSVDVILCMGDTLTHLTDASAARNLFALTAESLRSGGRFIATFRDYTQAVVGNARFIPVRSDADRILTCFLEYGRDHVDVHDMLHERDGDTWRLRVSVYRKVRLDPQWVAASLETTGLRVRREPGDGGMIRIVATKI